MAQHRRQRSRIVRGGTVPAGAIPIEIGRIGRGHPRRPANDNRAGASPRTIGAVLGLLAAAGAFYFLLSAIVQ